MVGPTPERVEHYVRLLERLGGPWPYFGESLCWTVVRPHQPGLTVDEVVSRLYGSPDAVTTARPDSPDVADDDDYDDVVFLERRGDAVIIVGYGNATAEEEVLLRLSKGAVVHSVFWMINNFSELRYLVDGVVVTGVETLNPARRWGTEPEALTGHLDALQQVCDTPGPVWETAMATVESMTGLGLEDDWFTRPQLVAKANSR